MTLRSERPRATVESLLPTSSWRVRRLCLYPIYPLSLSVQFHVCMTDCIRTSLVNVYHNLTIMNAFAWVFLTHIPYSLNLVLSSVLRVLLMTPIGMPFEISRHASTSPSESGRASARQNLWKPSVYADDLKWPVKDLLRQFAIHPQ